MPGEVLAERENAVLLLTLNRPDSLNAWTRQMLHRYADVLSDADQDPEVRAIVVTGAGSNFSAGADMSLLAGCDAGEIEHETRLVSLPIRLRTPVITAINGSVAGLGLIAALFTDIRFAAADARFTTAFSRRGLAADYGIAWLLPKLVGVSTALDLLLSARTFAGAEARELGLVDRALPANQVLATALAYARMLATECSSESMAEIKQQVYTGLDSGLDTATNDVSERMVAGFPGIQRAGDTDR